MTRPAIFIIVLVALAGALAGWPGTSAAHVGATGYSELRQDGATVSYRLGLEYEPLATAASFGAGAMSGSHAELGADLRAGRELLQAYLAPRLRVSVDGAPCRGPRFGDARAYDRSGTTYAELRLDFACPADAGAFAVRYEVDRGPDGTETGHTNIADFELGGASGRFVFDDDHTLLEAERTGTLATIGEFVSMGVEHILLGWDHVLFLLVLLLGARSLRSVVELATAFTVAHSVTLVLASVGWVELPADIVEPLIALSIAYVAVETILGGESRRRLLVVFAFGLLHGLGFAGTVDFDTEAAGRLLSSLVSFNVGIELGQAMIIAVVYPLLVGLRRLSWGDHAQVAGAAGAAALGLFWFSERLPL